MNASPSTASIPEYLVTKPSDSMKRIAAMAGTILRTVPRSSRAICRWNAEQAAARHGGQKDGGSCRRQRDDVDLGLLEIFRLGPFMPGHRRPLGDFEMKPGQFGFP